MAVNLTKVVKPSDFNLGAHFWNSPFRNMYTEEIVRNFIVACKKRDDTWGPMSFQEYKSLSDSMPRPQEEMALQWFVENKLMTFENGRFAVCHELIVKLAMYIQKE
jgi:hypothetical protein